MISVSGVFGPVHSISHGILSDIAVPEILGLHKSSESYVNHVSGLRHGCKVIFDRCEGSVGASSRLRTKRDGELRLESILYENN